jgi:uncharacterized delta-60 repeat protein
MFQVTSHPNTRGSTRHTVRAALIAFASLASMASLAADGGLDSTFNPNLNGNVRCILVQSDDKIMIGGDFTTVGGTSRNYLARLNSNGTLDTSFSTDFSGPINAIARRANGGYVVGGACVFYDDVQINYLAGLDSSGNYDSAFTQPGFNDDVASIDVDSNGKFLVAGYFTMAGSASRTFVARLNSSGSLDSTFVPNINGNVFVVNASLMMVGGNFTAVDNTSRDNLARLNSNGTLDTTFSAGGNYTIFAIVQGLYDIFAGGAFNSFHGNSGTPVTKNRFVAFDGGGSLIGTVGAPGANGQVKAIIRDGTAPGTPGNMFLGGDFTSVDGGSNTREKIALINTGGSLVTDFNAGTINGIINAIGRQSDGKIIIGGAFTSVQSTTRNRIARLLRE